MLKNKVKKEVLKNIEGLPDSIYIELDEYIQNNLGLNTKELIKRIEFYNFTEESLEYLLEVINNHPCSFNGIGPFIKKEGKWYNKKKMKKEKIIELKKENATKSGKILELEEENLRLRQELEKYRAISGTQ